MFSLHLHPEINVMKHSQFWSMSQRIPLSANHLFVTLELAFVFWLLFRLEK